MHGRGRPPKTERLRCECWCGRAMVYVTASMVKDGLTGTCHEGPYLCYDGCEYLGWRIIP